MPICSNTADANKNDEAISLVTQEETEKVSDLNVGDAYIVSENDEEFVDIYDDLDNDTELNLSDHSSDEDEVDLSNHSSHEDEESWLEITITEDANFDDGSRSGGRGRSGNIDIGGSSNVSGLGNQDANDDDVEAGEGVEVEISALMVVVMYLDSVIKMQMMMMVVEAGEEEGAEVEISALVVVVMYPDLVITMHIIMMVVEAREGEGVKVEILALVVVVLYPDSVITKGAEVEISVLVVVVMYSDSVLLEKQKKRHVSLLEAYQYTHTHETTKALGNETDEGLGDRTDEAVASETREYITRRSKRVAAAMEDEHGPDTSQHPPNDFNL
uniref:Uncharacterized protein n=1 Tax=Tanacetum cinerariifolium TaxID=118510 RepID=A0A699I5C4_TANCI|nr:hypothetical protein [Tanacetum cinerariifolium]